MSRKRILWLASWYPNRYDKFNGDFIQRHAQAASIDNDIYVIYLQDAEDIEDVEEEVYTHNGLTEQIIYYKKEGGITGKIRKQIQYFAIYKKAIKEYINKYGLPCCVHVHVPWKAGLLALWIKKKYRVPFVVSEHWGIYHLNLPDSYIHKSIFFKISVKLVFSKAYKLIVVSEKLGQDINKLVSSQKYHIVPNVVDCKIFKQADIKYSQFTFLHVSNMVLLKNVGDILISFKQFLIEENVIAQLILVGNKDNEYLKMASELGLLNNSVFFKGEISYNEVALEMQKAHCLILNSSYETFSCVVAEALCCGLPVIATKVGVVPDVITKKNGIQINNNFELLKAMKHFYDHYYFYDCKTISEVANGMFNYNAISAQFDSIYKGIKHYDG